MPAPRFRSRTFRRVYVRTPSGELKIHYKKRKNEKARCHTCNAVLPGSKQTVAYKKTAKTARRAQRPYGGVLCSKCMRAVIIKRFERSSE